MNINSSTKLICLLGQPVKQSFSPNIHNYLSKKYEKNKVYVCFDVEKNHLHKAVEGIKVLNMTGCNVTIPHKVDIIKYLDEVDENAKLIGAVNTVKYDENKLYGFNTDGRGFVKSLKDKEYILEGKKIMILGAGGACRSISVEIADNNVKSIEIRNRSDHNFKEITNIICNNFNTKCTFSTKTVEENDLRDIDILINTTPIGMGTKDCPINREINPPEHLLVCDIVYKPHETSLLTWAKKHNLKVVYGIDMLINQGLLAYEIWENIKTNENDFKEIKDIYFNSLK
ncbi:MAG: shikimate dehydrogenase [Terrisporobacter sp.]|uniref:shikimate dehydrogenase n=1 Tax=Terrisporobacter sp. TaxID=1965305 RepID=UPI002FC9CEC2